MSWKQIKKAQERLAKEVHLIPHSGAGDVEIAIGYPNTYHVGMSNLGLQLVYGFLNRIEGVNCERFFLPDPEDMEDYHKHSDFLRTLESQRAVADFDIVSFTCSYENDFAHFLQMLELCGLPLWSKERDEAHPLVMVGGAVTFLNPEVLSPFVDLFCVGEGEGMTEILIEVLREHKQAPRLDLLLALAQIPGFYVPQFYRFHYDEEGVIRELEADPRVPETIHKNYLAAEKFQAQDTGSAILSSETEFSRSYLIEVSRGCPYVCRFCTVGFSYPKIRWKRAKDLWERISQVREYDPKVGLISATIGNHPEIDELCGYLQDAQLPVAFSSLRSDRLPDSILETIVAGGTKTMTLAPETGSEDLRKSINKRFSDECYLTAVERAFKKGIKNIKMYSMVGLPEERDEDMETLVELVRKTRRLQKDLGSSGGRITLGLGLFVPKALTPYQWNAQADMKTANDRMKRVKKALGREGGVRVNSESPKTATLEGLLSRGDRRLAPLLHEVRWKPTFSNWNKALKRHGLSWDLFCYRERPWEEVLPWSHIKASWTRDRLRKDYERAKNQRSISEASRRSKGGKNGLSEKNVPG